MSTKHVRVATAICLVIGLLAFAWFVPIREQPSANRSLAADQPLPKSALGKAVETDTPSREQTSSTPSNPSRAAPLPSQPLPLSEQIAELEERAHAGDSRAACRLGATLRRCADPQLRLFRDTTDEYIAIRLALETQSAHEQEIALQKNLAARVRAAEILDGCESISFAETAQAPRYELQAAQAGNIASMLQIARGPIEAKANDFIVNPSLALLYQRNAIPMLIRAVEAGEPESLFILATLVGDPDYGHLVNQLPPSLRSADTIRGVLRLLNRRANPAGSVATQAPDAVQAAQDLYERYFEHSSRWEGSEFLAEVSGTKKYDPFNVAAMQDDDCDRTW